MEVEEERAEEHRAEVAIDFRGTSARKPTRLGLGSVRISRRSRKTPAGRTAASRNRIVASAPRACTEPAGRFHRGATRGEVVKGKQYWPFL